MTHIIKKKYDDIYLEEYEGGFYWTGILMDAKVFLTKMHAIDIAKIIDCETEII